MSPKLDAKEIVYLSLMPVRSWPNWGDAVHCGRITGHRYLEPKPVIVLQAEELVDRDKTWRNATPSRVAQAQRQTVDGRDEYA
jgi:hypothetical protein